MKKLFCIIVSTTFLVATVLNQALAEEAKLTLTGSSTVAPLVLEIAKAFEKKNPGIKIDVQSGGSSRGISDARSGLANLGMASRALNPDETDLNSYVIAKDGVCLVLNKKNPVAKLTDEQVVKIYTAEIKNWKEVGGVDAPITVVNKAEGRSTLELFENYFKIKNSQIKASVVIGDNEQGIKTVAGNPNSIGYVSVGTAEFNVQQGSQIKLLAMGTVPASTENVKNGKFPLSRPLNLIVKGELKGLSKKFVEFAQSQEVSKIVQQQYFVPASK